MEKKHRIKNTNDIRSKTSKNSGQIENSELSKAKTAFGVDNAKQMDTNDTVRYFVPQPAFFRLFVAKNQILLGSRGSGKTTWVRMLAHDHVVLAAKDGDQRTNYARDALKRNLIGIYVPASAAFAGDLKNKSWQTESEAERYFVWRLNLHICSALTYVINSCVHQYLKPGQNYEGVQAEVCKLLAHAWTEGKKTCSDVQELRLILSELELKHQTEIRRRRTSSMSIEPYEDHFDNDLLLPLRHSINIIRSRVSIPEGAVWMICLDEVEYLSELHHRILNTQMRSSNSDVVFKITTMPFAHHTLATNFGDPVREGNDFEYINVDQESIDSRGGQVEGEFLSFARSMFKRRMSFLSPQLEELTLKSLLGFAPLIDEKKIESPEDRDNFLALLRRHANAPTLIRAERLKGSPKFKNEIVRKMHGALLLRDAISAFHGNSKLRIYSGEATVVRCCDGNARRLMRVVNQLIQKIKVDSSGNAILPIDAAIQNHILESLARDTLNRVYSEPPNGALTARYLEAIGLFMKWQFSSSNRLLGTDQVTSVMITKDDGPDAQLFIKQAVQLSLMIPARDVTLTASDRSCVGVFHIAFLFAPFFHLLPRRNDSVRLSKVLAHRDSKLNFVEFQQQTFFEQS
jgi:hypothetical protein